MCAHALRHRLSRMAADKAATTCCLESSYCVQSLAESYAHHASSRVCGNAQVQAFRRGPQLLLALSHRRRRRRWCEIRFAAPVLLCFLEKFAGICLQVSKALLQGCVSAVDVKSALQGSAASRHCTSACKSCTMAKARLARSMSTMTCSGTSHTSTLWSMLLSKAGSANVQLYRSERVGCI